MSEGKRENRAVLVARQYDLKDPNDRKEDYENVWGQLKPENRKQQS